MAELIWVVPNEPGKVGAWEVHPDHPGGEAWVAWDSASEGEPGPVCVALTPYISLRLGRQFIRQVSAPKRRTTRRKTEASPPTGE